MKKTCIIWVGAFGFAIVHHLSKKHPQENFYAFEKDTFVLNHLKNTHQSPYFFQWVTLWENVIFLESLHRLCEFERVFLIIPAQFIAWFLTENASNFKSGVEILNLSKWIDLTTMQTPSDIVKQKLAQFHHYAVLSGGMIAEELVGWKKLWAQIACKDFEVGQELKDLFQSENLQISLSRDVKNTELFGSLKNVFALYMGYLEWSWYGMSTIGYYFCELYKELPILLTELGGDEQIDFSSFALGWDLIATCFGNSRNRYFGKLVGEWMKVVEVEAKLKQEKKHAEWYYTLLGIKNVILSSSRLYQFRKIVKIFI